MITIKVKELELTLEEAKELYEELKKIFETPVVTHVPGIHREPVYGDQPFTTCDCIGKVHNE